MRYQFVFVLACVGLCAAVRAQENNSSSTNGAPTKEQLPTEIHIDENCRISRTVAELGGSRQLVYKDKKVCSVDPESVSKRDVIENLGGQRKQTTVTIREHTFTLHDSGAQPVTFAIEQKVPKDWQVDSDPQPKVIVGGIATFLVNVEPGQTVNLHVGERTPPAVPGEQAPPGVSEEQALSAAIEVELPRPANFTSGQSAGNLPKAELKAVMVPQRVKLSYVEGDVRFNRGDEKKPNLKRPWEQARIDLPIEQNYAVSTGPDGRAEIEFQTAGVLYVAGNSTLLFNELTVNDGIPTTRVRLVSGTITTDVEPLQGEVFVIAMGPGSYSVQYPQFDFTRIESYMGGMSFTPQVDAGSHFEQTHSSGDQLVKLGETLVYAKGQPPEIEGVGKDKGPDGWDDWVDERCAERQAATEIFRRAPSLIPPALDVGGLSYAATLSQCEAYAVCCKGTTRSELFEEAASQGAADRQAASEDARKADTVSIRELQTESAMDKKASVH